MPNPSIPESIVVHLGAPNEDAENVTVSFLDYIKNVASSEIYPTWPREALRANILAQISVALNRIYTEYYRSMGKPFDITSSTAYDQSFVYQRDIYENISELVDEIFNDYIRRDGFIEPLFATFCDGVEVNCNGLSQWGSVTLANQGNSYFDILRNYYGDDIQIVFDAPVDSIPSSAPPVPFKEGDTGRDVENVQIRLNRISQNYPGIPKIANPDGFFGPDTTAAVKEFQKVFNLTQDGIVGRSTWYKIQFIYNAVKKLYEINSEGLSYSELPQNYPGILQLGDSGRGALVLQYYLEYISLFVPTVQTVTPDGSFGQQTLDSVISFQKTYGLPETGIVDRAVWNAIQSTYYNILSTIDYEFMAGATLPFPGRILIQGISGEDVRALQEYLNYVSNTYTEIPKVTVDGVFGPSTEAAVIAFNRLFDIPGGENRVTAQTWRALTDIYEDLYIGSFVREGQYPGYTIE
ncbi:MAG: peptidoglycan-binding protein [Clostridia bacterium]|nr:peptidoglycan-binding protein [Clostridia bacterium]